MLIMQKQLLTNVAIIRPILILMLVFYHAFAIYSGAWSPIVGFPEIKLYWWLDWLSYAFMLETFVFVSGYVFGYQVRTKGESVLSARRLIPKKFRRLIIPSMFFSLLYIVLFGNIGQPISATIYGMLDGTAHMWFLPMLFWCFIGIWVIEKLRMQAKIALPLLLVVCVCSHVALPLRIGDTMYYMLFFYVGYVLQRRDVKVDVFYTPRTAVSLVLAFAVLFPPSTILQNALSGGGYYPPCQCKRITPMLFLHRACHAVRHGRGGGKSTGRKASAVAHKRRGPVFRGIFASAVHPGGAVSSYVRPRHPWPILPALGWLHDGPRVFLGGVIPA